MRILLISPTQTGIGGVAQHVQGLKKFLENKGNYVEIMSSENTLTIPIKGLKNPSFMISSLIKSKFKTNFDIIHAHNIPAAYAMKNMKGKKILTQHGIFSQQIDLLHGNTAGNLSGKFERNALMNADAVTVISKEAKQYYEKLGFHTIHIPNAIDIENISSNEERKYPNQLIFAGRLSKEKGVETLIEIGKKLPSDIHLIILGSGPEEKKIRYLDMNHENIHFLGYQTKEKTISLIRGSDILVQPSLKEGISSTLLEAMASKTTIITSKVGGNIDLIENDINGLILDPRDSDSFVKEILNLFMNKEKRNSLENNGLQTVQKYDWKNVGKLYLDLYQSIL